MEDLKSSNTFYWIQFSKKVTKVILIYFNMICIGFASWTTVFTKVDTEILQQYGEQKAAGPLTGNQIIIAISEALVVTDFLGSIGILWDKVKIINLYIICHLVLVVSEFPTAMYVAVQRGGLLPKVSDWLWEDFYNNYTGNIITLEHKISWDKLQSTYKCCGLNDPKNYPEMLGRPIDISCCAEAYLIKNVTDQVKSYQSCLKLATYYTEGCEDAITDLLKSDTHWFYALVVNSLWIETLSILLALSLANYVKNGF